MKSYSRHIQSPSWNLNDQFGKRTLLLISEMVFAVGLWSDAKMTEIEYFCKWIVYYHFFPSCPLCFLWRAIR